jgi:hypothetical protein
MTDRSRSIRALVLSLVTLLGVVACDSPRTSSGAASEVPQEARRSGGTGGVNAPEMLDRPYVVLISFDGYRHDYLELFDPPVMNRLAAAGVRAERLVPAFPTKTFPNNYSIATGMYPGSHGLVANTFLDPSSETDPEAWPMYRIADRDAVEDGAWYGGEPIWVTAERQGMVSSAFFFVGTEAPIQGIQPHPWMKFDADIPGEVRVDSVLTWLSRPEETRPHLITLYFEHVDGWAHYRGPESDEARAAVMEVDGHLGELLDGIEALPHGDQVYVVAVSDHGLGGYVTEGARWNVDEAIDTALVKVVGGGPFMHIHVPSDHPDGAAALRDRINAAWEHGRAFLPEDTPDYWGVGGNARFGQLILVPEPGYGVSQSSWTGIANPGDHGWAPEPPEGWREASDPETVELADRLGSPVMSGLFIATGPRLAGVQRIGPVRNVDVYPFLTEILGLVPASGIDGSPDGLVPLLDSERSASGGAN